MNRKAALVIGGASTVEPPLQLGCHEWRCPPTGRISLGLDLVVGVEAHGWLARWCWKPAENRRRSVPGLDDADVGALQIFEELHKVVCGALHPSRPRKVGTYRLNGHQLFQIR